MICAWIDHLIPDNRNAFMLCSFKRRLICSFGLIFAITGLAKIISFFGTDRILYLADPVFGIPRRHREEGQEPAADELRRLRRENAKLKIENDILKKAAVILGTKPQLNDAN